VCWRLVVAPPISSGSVEPAPLHLGGDVRHLVEARRDQAREPDDVAPSASACRGSCRRHHHAEIDDLVVVAAEHHADDVLADVVDVALHGGEHDLALAARALPRFCFSSSMNGVR
jgi:hypothetical protein